MSARPSAILCALLLSFFVGGCAGARTTVVASHASYPVSLSRGLRDADGSLVTPEHRRVVGTFSASHTVWNLLYTAAKLNPTTDISDEVNQQVTAAGGDAIIHLTIVTKHCVLNYFSFPLGILPFFPSCANVEIHGDIVRVEHATTTPPPTTSHPTLASAEQR